MDLGPAVSDVSSACETASVPTKINPNEKTFNDCESSNVAVSTTDEFFGDGLTENSNEGKTTVTPEDAGRGRLSFENSFLGDWTAAAQRVDSGRRLAELIQQVMAERAHLEEAYSKGLEKLAHRVIAVPTESQHMTTAINAIRLEALRKSEQHYDLAESLRSDVLKSTLTNTIQNHSTVFKQIRMDGINISKNLKSAKLTHQTALQQYEQLCRDADAAAIECQKAERVVPSLRSKLAHKALGLARAALSAEKHYAQSVENLNETQKIYVRQMGVILRSLQDMDEKRISCVKDALRKYIVYQTSLLRNQQYDLQSTIGAIEGIDGTRDIEEFIERFQVPSSAYSPCCMLPWTKIQDASSFSLETDTTEFGEIPAAAAHAANAAGVIARNLLRKSPLVDKVMKSAANHWQGTTTTARNLISNSSSPTKESVKSPAEEWEEGGVMPQPPSDATIASIESNFEQVLSALWKGDLKPLASVIDVIQNDLSSSLYRYVLCRLLTRRRCEKKLKLPVINSLRALGLLCGFLLDWADRQSDVFTGRLIMIFSQQFYCEDSKSPDGEWQLSRSGFLNLVESNKKNSKMCSDLVEGVGRPSIHARQPELPTSDDECNCEHDEERSTDDKSGNKEESSTFKWFLHRCIYHHALWNHVQFWEDALILTISEEKQREILSRRWRTLTEDQCAEEERNFVERNPCVSALPSFAQCMVAFGILEPQVMSLVQKVCIQCNLGPDYSNYLLSCLSSDTTTALKSDSSFWTSNEMSPKSCGDTLSTAHLYESSHKSASRPQGDRDDICLHPLPSSGAVSSDVLRHPLASSLGTSVGPLLSVSSLRSSRGGKSPPSFSNYCTPVGSRETSGGAVQALGEFTSPQHQINHEASSQESPGNDLSVAARPDIFDD